MKQGLAAKERRENKGEPEDKVLCELCVLWRQLNLCSSVFICGSRSEPPRDAHEGIPVIGRAGHAEVDAGVELDVLGQRVSQAEVHGADPA